MNDTPAVRPTNREASELLCIAQRMRATLMEVLGDERGEGMYSIDWLVERVKFHLDPARCDGEVFVVDDPNGGLAGHCIVRVDTSDELGDHGLFSTTWVQPSERRGDVAQALLSRGEAWMVSRGLQVAATKTSLTNRPLIALYERNGYAVTLRTDEMLALTKSL